MQVRFTGANKHGERRIINQRLQEVGQIIYDTSTEKGKAWPYVIYINGRGYLSRHAYLNDAKVAAREYFDEKAASA